MPVSKAQILDELRRTAKANGGVALGWRRFEGETGIAYHDWYGRLWTRWSDAVREAGLRANSMSEAYDETFLLEKLVTLTRTLGRVPTTGDLRLASTTDDTIPSEKVFRRLGQKASRAKRIIAFCEATPGKDDVAALWKAITATAAVNANADDETVTQAVVGYVYLLQHGSRHEYKIGRTNNAIRREGEIGIELPEQVRPVHYIETDDPSGVENYWHRRFAAKRKQGEWFALAPEDVRAFKRWKRIY